MFQVLSKHFAYAHLLTYTILLGGYHLNFILQMGKRRHRISTL